MNRVFKCLKIKRGFTLMECIMAVFILAITAAVLLPSLSSSYAFIVTSQSLDGLVAVAEYNALTYPYNPPSFEFISMGDTGYSYSYSNNFKAHITFVSPEGVDNANMTSDRTYYMVASIVEDDRGNRVVYYMVDPNEVKDIYAREYMPNQ